MKEKKGNEEHKKEDKQESKELEEHDCSDCSDCSSCHPEHQMSQEDLVHSLNVLMNALISVLVDKKVLTEKDIHDKLVNEFGAQPVEK